MLLIFNSTVVYSICVLLMNVNDAFAQNTLEAIVKRHAIYIYIYVVV